MQASDGQQQNDYTHLVQSLSALMVQVNALQALARAENTTSSDGAASPLAALRNGLALLEQMAREALFEARSLAQDAPLPELIGVTLAEALSRAVEETAEALDLSSRITFSGEERTLAYPGQKLLYRVAQEALYQVQRHAGTRRLRFAFNYGHDEVQMSIEDDGTPVSEESGDVEMDGHSLATSGSYMPPPYVATPASIDAITSDLRQRIEALGGSLEVSTKAGEGAALPGRRNSAGGTGNEVRVRIPYTGMSDSGAGQAAAPTINRGATHASGEAQSPSPTIPNRSVRVLVVEAQAVTRAGLRRLLESYPDLEVVGEAADGVQAVSETLELGPQVVLMDMQLPDGQSLEALRQIKQLNLDAHVLLLSALDREDYLYETLRAGAGGYVLKDIAPDELAEAVRTVARGEVLVQPQIARRLLSQFSQGRPYMYGQGLPPPLTAREQEVLRLLAKGLRNKEMAARLHVSERTINFHLANIYQKLNVSGRTEALSKALELGTYPFDQRPPR